MERVEEEKMRIDEFKNEIRAIGRKYGAGLDTVKEPDSLNIMLADMFNYKSVIASVCETSENMISTDYPILTLLDFNLTRDVLNVLVEYAKTPISEREEEKRFIVPLPGLVTTDGEQQYLTHKQEHFFACRRNKDLRQTWKEKHLKILPKEYRQYAVELSKVE